MKKTLLALALVASFVPAAYAGGRAGSVVGGSTSGGGGSATDASKVSKTGDTMSGALTVQSTVTAHAIVTDGASSVFMSSNPVITVTANDPAGTGNSLQVFQSSICAASVGLSTTTASYNIGYNSAFNSLYISAPTNGTILKAPDVRMTLTNTSAATTAGGGTIINMSGDKVWTLLNSTAGTGGQLIYGAINGAYGWGIHMHAPTTAQGVLNLTAGIHDPDGTGFVGVSDATNSIVFHGYMGNASGNASPGILLEGETAWQSTVYSGQTPTYTGTYTGFPFEFKMRGADKYTIDYLGHVVIGSTPTASAAALAVEGSTFVVTAGKVGIGTTAPTQLFQVQAPTGTAAGNALIVSSNTSVQAIMGVSTVAGGFTQIGSNSNHPMIMLMNAAAVGNIGTAGGMRLGDSTAAGTFIRLEVSTGTFALPRYTSTQVAAITPVQTGQSLFNTTINSPCVSTGTAINAWGLYRSTFVACQ